MPSAQHHHKSMKKEKKRIKCQSNVALIGTRWVYIYRLKVIDNFKSFIMLEFGWSSLFITNAAYFQLIRSDQLALRGITFLAWD